MYHVHSSYMFNIYSMLHIISISHMVGVQPITGRAGHKKWRYAPAQVYNIYTQKQFLIILMFILQKKILCPQQGPGRSKDTHNTTEYFVSPGEQLYGIQIEAMVEKSILEPIHYVGGRVSVGIIFHA